MANPNADPPTEPFSARYALVHGAEVLTWSNEEAIMDRGMYESLGQRFGQPVVGYIGGLHYHFKPQRQIPTSAVAVPEDNHADPSALLIQK